MSDGAAFIAGAWIAAALVVLACIGCVLLVSRALRVRRLPRAISRDLQADMQSLLSSSAGAMQVLEAEKIVDHAMKVLGYTGSFGDKLQQAGARFSSLQTLWDAHKLRNRIAHERAMVVGKADAERALRAFMRALRDLS